MAWQDVANQLLGGQAAYTINQLNQVNPNFDWTPYIQSAAQQLTTAFPDMGWQDPNRGSPAGIPHQILSNAQAAGVGDFSAANQSLSQTQNQQDQQILAAQNPPDKGLFGGGLGTILGIGGLALGGLGLAGVGPLAGLGGAAGAGADLAGEAAGLGISDLGAAGIGGAAAGLGGAGSLADLVAPAGQAATGLGGADYGSFLQSIGIDPASTQFAGGALSNADIASAIGSAGGNLSLSDLGSLSNLKSLAGPLANLAGGGIAALAAKSAAQKQINAAGNATDLARGIYNTQTANLSPFLQAGTQGQAGLNYLLGNLNAPTDPTIANTMGVGAGYLTHPFGAQQLAQDPIYSNALNFAVEQGNRAIGNRAAASGTYYAPSTLQDLSKFQIGTANQYGQDAFNRYQTGQQNIYGRLQNLAGSGQQAAVQQGGFGGQFAGQAGQNILGAGNAAAAGTVGQANALSQGLGGAYNAFLMNQILSQLQA